MTCSGSTYILNGINRVLYAVVTGDSFNYLIDDDRVIVNDPIAFYQLDIANEVSSMTQELVRDANGEYYNTTFNLVTVEEDAFDSLEETPLVLKFLDNNGIWFIAGHEEPLFIDSIGTQLADGGDSISVVISTNTYFPIMPLNT
jgi:hypothetical protein